MPGRQAACSAATQRVRLLWFGLLAVGLTEVVGQDAPPRHSLGCSRGMLSALTDASKHPLAASQTPFGLGDGLMVYVQLSKVGSTSMRSYLNSALGSFDDFSFVHSNGAHRSGHASLQEATLAQGKYGLCNLMWARGLSRRCTYFTLLREPLARLKSSYDYFCKSCAEGSRYCKNPLLAGRSGVACPKMSLLDFAYLEGNVYTHEFSGAYACGPCDDATSERPYPEACADAALPIHRGALLAAAKVNLGVSVFPLILEELDIGSLHAHMNFSNSFKPPPYFFTRNEHVNHTRPSDEGGGTGHALEAIEEEVRHVLQEDVQLYEYARDIARRRRTGPFKTRR